MAEYRVEELARLAGTSVRNVRVYQDRGLLAKPRRQGRVGIYTEAHLARLRIIGQLLQRGYTFANIAELLRAWESGGSLNEVLGFESALGDAWSDEVPTYLTVEELADLIGKQPDPEETERAIELGLFEVEGDRLRVPSPRLLHAGVELIRAGMSVAEVLDIAAMLRSHVDVMAAEMVRTVSDHILRTHAPTGMVLGEHVPAAAEVVRRLRPMAQQAVDAMLAQAMAHSIEREIGAHFAEVMELLRGSPAGESA
jgi:DNA-binding transcriptional MerR regulator